MWLRTAWCLAVLLIWLPSLGYSRKTTQNPVEKMRHLARQFQGIPIPFDDANFTETVDEDSHGNYDTAVLFTVKDTGRYKCAICPEATQHFTLASRSYSIDVPYEQHDLFFGVSAIDYAPRIFQEKRINAVPFVVFYPTKKGGESKTIELGDPAGFTARSLLDRFGKTNVRIYTNPARYMPIATFATIVFGVLASVISSNPQIICFWKLHSFWYVLSLGLYGCATSGVISCIIRGLPWTTFDDKGHLSVFTDQSGSQTITEGLFMASLLFMSAFAIIFMHKTVTSGENSDLLKATVCAVFIGIFVAVFTRYVKIFQTKQGWVAFGDMVPAELYAVLRYLHTRIAAIITRYTGIRIPYSIYSKALGLGNF